MSFSVRILKDGEPVNGARVRLAFTSVVRGMSDPEYTSDSDGIAEFDGYDDGEVEVFVDGQSYGTESYRDGDSVDIDI